MIPMPAMIKKLLLRAFFARRFSPLRGYTLVELSVSTSIIAILAVGALAMIQKKNEADNVRETHMKLGAIKAAIDKFARVNGRIPCPASPSLPESSTYFGKDQKASDAGGDAPIFDDVAVKCVGPDVNFNAGAVPVRTLNLSDDFTYDGWNRKFIYKITPAAADAKKFLKPSFRGDIRVVDLRGNNKTDVDNAPPNNQGALYVLISYGSNGRNVAWGRALTDGDALTAPDPSQAVGFEQQNLRHERGIYIQDDPSEGFDDAVAFGSKSKVSPPKETYLPTALHADACSNADFLSARPELLEGLGGSKPMREKLVEAATTLSALCDYSPKTANISQTVAATEDVAFRFDADRPALDGSQPGSNVATTWQDAQGKTARPTGGSIYRSASINGRPAFKSSGGYFAFDSAPEGMDAADEKQYFGRTPDNEQQFTFFMAIRTGTNVMTSQTLYSSGGNFSVFIESAKLKARIGNVTISAANNATPETNYVVSLARGKDGYALILNQETGLTHSSSLPAATIGQAQYLSGANGAGYFTGAIGEAILYRYMLPQKRFYEVILALSSKWGAIFSFNANSPVSCPYKGQEYIRTPSDPELKCQCPDGTVLNSQMGVSNACIQDSSAVGECVPVAKYDQEQIEQATAANNKKILLPSDFSDLLLWLDAADCSTVSLKSGRKVAVWQDKSAQRNDFSMDDAAYMPTYENINSAGTFQNQPLGTMRFSRLEKNRLVNSKCLGQNCTDLYMGKTAPSAILNVPYRQASIYVVAQIVSNTEQAPYTLFNSGTHDWGIKLKYNGIPYMYMRPLSSYSGIQGNFVADKVQSGPTYAAYGNAYHIFHGYIQASQSTDQALIQAPKMEMYVDGLGALYDQVWTMKIQNGVDGYAYPNTVNGKFYTDRGLAPFPFAYDASQPNTIGGALSSGVTNPDWFDGRIGEIVVIKDYMNDKVDKKEAILRYLNCKWRNACN
ncbi:MAG: type II secretion system protein [Rickettsiales bacterium]